MGVGQLIDQEEIHKQCLSKNPEERIKALNQLSDNFPSLPDKQQAWNDLIKLTNDEDSWVRREAVSTLLGSAFPCVPDKQQAWNDLIKLTIKLINDEDRWARYTVRWVRDKAVSVIVSAFSQVPDKQQAWSELHNLPMMKTVM